MVNHWLPPALRVFAGQCASSSAPSRPNLLPQILSLRRLQIPTRNLFDCARRPSFGWAGAQRNFAMFEAVTAVMGLVSAGVFLAHAFEGVRSRA